jgi:methylamine dehydrogenase heavy chain
MSGGALPSSNGHRVYVSDLAISHAPDGKIHIVDGDSLRYLGQLSAGAAAVLTIAPDGSELYVATTYYTRLYRGERSDQVDVYDAATLRLRAEIPLPPKKAPSLPYISLSAISGDGKLLFVQNATPATSISVVDLKRRKFLAEIPTPGCYALFAPPSAPDRVSTLCGDGTLLTITFKANAEVASSKRSAKFFDADKDPVFITAGHEGDRFFFVSFQGQVHAADLRGEEAKIDAPWSLLTAADQSARWRPGGYQMTTVEPATGRLYVGMHSHGGEGSHKNPAEEIWTFDIKSHKRLARTPTGAPVISIQSSADADARLFALEGEKMGLLEFDARGDLKLLRRADGFGDTSLGLQVH